MQAYIVDESFENLDLPNAGKQLCRDLRIELTDADMDNYNRLWLKSDKPYPLDGMTAKECWEMVMETGVKLKQFDGIHGKEFNDMVLKLNRMLMHFSAVADGAKLKYINEDGNCEN